MKNLIINNLTREKRYAWTENQKVEKLMIHQPKHTSLVGNIYLGIVTKVMPGMNAAFIDIGEEKNGFVYRDKLASFVLSEEPLDKKDKKNISSYLHQGERLIVQVDKDATGTKGPRLTGIVELAGKNLIYMPKGKYVAISKKMENNESRENLRQLGTGWKEKEEGVLFRTASESATLEEIQLELDSLRNQYKEMEQKEKLLKKSGSLLVQNHFLMDIVESIKLVEEDVHVIVDDRLLFEKLKEIFPELSMELYMGKENIFSFYHLDGALEKVISKTVWLENGSYLVIDEIEALTVIDVNTGKYSGKQNVKDTVLHTNLLAAEESARQIRLRDIGGMVLIDFIDMKTEKEKKLVLERMKEELQKDDRQTNVVGYTQLGILQLKRKKTKVSVSESLMEICPHCEGTGRILSAESIAFRLERELYEYRNKDIEIATIELSEDVQAVFCGEQDIHKKRLEDIIGFELTLKIVKEDNPFYRVTQLY